MRGKEQLCIVLMEHGMCISLMYDVHDVHLSSHYSVMVGTSLSMDSSCFFAMEGDTSTKGSLADDNLCSSYSVHFGR